MDIYSVGHKWYRKNIFPVKPSWITRAQSCFRGSSSLAELCALQLITCLLPNDRFVSISSSTHLPIVSSELLDSSCSRTSPTLSLRFQLCLSLCTTAIIKIASKPSGFWMHTSASWIWACPQGSEMCAFDEIRIYSCLLENWSHLQKSLWLKVGHVEADVSTSGCMGDVAAQTHRCVKRMKLSVPAKSVMVLSNNKFSIVGKLIFRTTPWRR